MVPARFHRWTRQALRVLPLLMLFAGPAYAMESAPVASPRATATLVSDTDAVAAGQPFRVGLRLRLVPGWHTYGEHPGDAGAAPELSLQLPPGARASGIHWPPTQTFKEGPLVTHGYTGEVVLPVTVTPGASGGAAIEAHAVWLVCERICVPEEGSFRVDLPAGTPAPSAEASLFAATAAPREALPLGRTLGLAFLGGLILNLMPCVFPVLAMKAVSLAAGAVRGEVRAHALSYAAGVVLTFAALGAALLGFREAGAAVGWGFQFQSPAFVAGMAWLLFAVGLNLSGVFQLGGAFAGAGQALAGRGGHVGSFFTGLLAVVVATPCTAPFMGAAIAGALAAPAAITILVFVAMGMGLAAPYVLLATIPALARAAPRPGRWMEVFRQALAFPMYGASAWLLWVLSREAGSAGVLAGASGFVLLGFAAWALGIAQASSSKARHLGHAAAFAAALGAIALLTGIGLAPPGSVVRTSEAGAEPFSEARLAALRAEGRPVFVNMTAAWCVTCLLNERVALAGEAVREAFDARHVAYLKGDWTRQDPEITDFLRAHGREGVPLYLYYPPGGQTPETLPQILTESTVLERIGAVAGS